MHELNKLRIEFWGNWYPCFLRACSPACKGGKASYMRVGNIKGTRSMLTSGIHSRSNKRQSIPIQNGLHSLIRTSQMDKQAIEKGWGFPPLQNSHLPSPLDSLFGPGRALAHSCASPTPPAKSNNPGQSQAQHLSSKNML